MIVHPMAKYLTLAANFFYPYRKVQLALCVIALSAMLYLFVFGTIALQEKYLRVTFLSLLWCLILYVLSHSFYSDQEPRVAKSFFAKVKNKLVGVFAFIYSIIFLGLVLATLHISMKLFTL